MYIKTNNINIVMNIIFLLNSKIYVSHCSSLYICTHYMYLPKLPCIISRRTNASYHTRGLLTRIAFSNNSEASSITTTVVRYLSPLLRSRNATGSRRPSFWRSSSRNYYTVASRCSFYYLTTTIPTVAFRRLRIPKE